MADYKFYTGTYLGNSIPEADFPRLAKRAEEQLSRYKRIYTVTAPGADSEDMALCAMADALYYFETAQNGTAGPVASASIGSVSVSYGAAGAVDLSARGQVKELYRCACLYLDIYRGCGGC
jgi:hypothetical protein